jgi:flagellar hook-associated protein 2
MASIGSLVFTGISKYSSDLQSILQRTVSIAQLPAKALQNQQTDNLSRKQALIALNPAVSSLGSAVRALGALAANKGVVASSSDSSTVSVVNTGATGPGTFTVSNILSLASAASETSLSGYADPNVTPVSTAGLQQVDLVVGGTTYNLDLTGANTLTGLRDAINNSGAAATASILTIGSSSYLSLSANNTGATTLTLTDVAAIPANSVSLISQTNQGADADFELNGIHTTKASNTVNDIIPGLSFTLQAQTVGSVTLSLQTNSTQLSSALQTFVSTYNAVFDQTSAQIGPSAGLLAGNSLIRNLSDDLRQVSSYYYPTDTSSIRGLSDLGVVFDSTGHLSFSSSSINQLSSSQLTDAFKFLGSSQSGFAAIASSFTQLSDPLSGLIRLQEDSYDTQNVRLSTQISNLNDRVALIQSSTTAQLQSADALLAKLEAQQTTINASLQSLNYVVYGRSTNANGL